MVVDSLFYVGGLVTFLALMGIMLKIHWPVIVGHVVAESIFDVEDPVTVLALMEMLSPVLMLCGYLPCSFFSVSPLNDSLHWEQLSLVLPWVPLVLSVHLVKHLAVQDPLGGRASRRQSLSDAEPCQSGPKRSASSESSWWRIFWHHCRYR